jgi:GNAT superfamily N-acetyltransferase
MTSSPADDLSFREIELSSPEYAAMLRLREAVLRRPLGLTFTAEEMALEPACLHLAALAGAAVIGTVLLQPLDAGTIKMRQVSIAPERQRQGIGEGLVRFAEEVARQRGFTRMIAHARSTAAAFYERLGYTPEGEPFLETTIPHLLVTKPLAPA